jgi:hypothetical protein
MDGTQWDRLTVLRFSHIDKHGTAHWDCVCRCGKELTVNGKCLRRGTTRSCGCFKIEIAIASAKDLLLMYDTFLDEMKAKPSATKITKIAESTPVVPSAGKEFYTRDAIAAAALVALGYTISRVDPPEGQWRWPRFHFADDGRAMSRSKDVSQQIKVWMDKQ